MLYIEIEIPWPVCRQLKYRSTAYLSVSTVILHESSCTNVDPRSEPYYLLGHFERSCFIDGRDFPLGAHIHKKMWRALTTLLRVGRFSCSCGSGRFLDSGNFQWKIEPFILARGGKCSQLLEPNPTFGFKQPNEMLSRFQVFIWIKATNGSLSFVVWNFLLMDND